MALTESVMTTMNADPTDPDTADGSTPSSSTEGTDSGPAGGRASSDDARRPLEEEAPEADTAEQRADVVQRGDDPLTDADRSAANDADIAEQARVVELDEDDYR